MMWHFLIPAPRVTFSKKKTQIFLDMVYESEYTKFKVFIVFHLVRGSGTKPPTDIRGNI